MRNWIPTAINLFNQKKIQEAKKLFLEIHKNLPSEKTVLEYLSIIYYQESKFAQSEKYSRRLREISPDNIANKIRLSQSLLKQNKLEEIPHLLNEISETGKNLDIVNYNFSRYHLKTGNIIRAIQYLNDARILNPKLHEANYLLGNTYLNIGQFSKAEQLLKKLINVDKFRSPALKKLSAVYLKQGNLSGAEQILKAMIKEGRVDDEDNHNLGMICFLREDHKSALKYFIRAMESNKTISFQTLLYFMYSKISICDWKDYDVWLKKLIKGTDKYLRLDDSRKFQMPVYILNYFNVPRKFIGECASVQSRLISDEVQPKSKDRHSSSKRNKIRIGYISTKFNISPGGVLFKDVFKYHDKSRYEIFGYSLKNKKDPIADTFRETFPVFRDLSKVNDYKSAEIIENDNIDILITLAGFADGMRMHILAYRPSPIQINWEGYNESMGSEFIDYSILDETLCNEETKSLYSEKIIELPGCAMFNSPLEEKVSLTRADLNLPQDKFIYASFNHPKKIAPSDLDNWANILTRNESAIILIFDNSSEYVRNNLTSEFKKRNIGSHRLFFTGKMDIYTHWARFKLADLFLDTQIVNAHTTAIESLRCGTPILTLSGNTNYGRYGKSILRAAGLDQLIAGSSEEYIEKALSFSESNRISQLKFEVDQAKGSHLFDTKTNIKYLEMALESVWNKQISGRKPEDLKVTR